MSVAWIVMSGDGDKDARRRVTVPGPHALSWTTEPDGMGGMRVRLRAANYAVTVSSTETPGEEHEMRES